MGGRTLAAPPTLDEMLVGGSEAQAQLARMFVDQQPPHRIHMTEIKLIKAAEGAGHRRLAEAHQAQDRISVTVVTVAPDSDTARKAVTTLASMLGGSITDETIYG